jgi:hypothetical protein
MSTKDKMRDSIRRAIKARDELRDIELLIVARIRELESRLFAAGVDAFDSGEYSWACRKGQWRFIKTEDPDRRPVLDLPRNERADFLLNLKLPDPLHGDQ